MVGDIIGVQTVTGSGNIELAGIGSFGGLDMASGVMIGTARGLKFTGDNTTIDFEGGAVDAASRQGIRFIETSGASESQAILYNANVTGVGGTEVVRLNSGVEII